ncbi:hypothetical protein HOT75_gp111 [Gordonia phage Daredevil]|uniref:Lipoprotein n=1 Tax=Gordonia phage Daredevil TaxID=2283286 RepID=A0A345MIW7_9CAUD|nr:hypothetical protein HOT75_gp111 [Gordonia phage Daredevil]AXH70498.1 hypothetical protein SEA_DAREDEVIL_111 [Gordonia phage Daredevil]
MRKSDRKKVIGWSLAVAAVGALTLTGCGAGSSHFSGDGDFGQEPKLMQIELPDGRTIPCLFLGKSQHRVMSCDWDEAH